MENERRNSTASSPPSIENLLLAAESNWREQGCETLVFTIYTLRKFTVYPGQARTPKAFQDVRGWLRFLKAPAFTHKFEPDERGWNGNQFWNDLEVKTFRYNIASVLQGLLWLTGTEKHGGLPDHRKLSLDRQPVQPPPFPEWVMSPDGVSPSVIEDEKYRKAEQRQFDSQRAARELADRMAMRQEQEVIG